MAEKFIKAAPDKGFIEGYKFTFPSRITQYTEDDIEVVANVMRRDDTMTQGAFLEKFEADFCEFTGAKHAFAVDTATNALRLAAAMCRFEPGDEVIIPGYTFCATATPFAAAGAKIVWADMDPVTWNISPADIEKKITPKTKALVIVHLLGMPCDMRAIMPIVKKHDLILVEDCAQAPGAMLDGQHVGTFGDYGCFSFHSAKNITTLGEGGMLTVKDDDKAAKIPGLRYNGCRGFDYPRDRYWVPAMSTVDFDYVGEWPFNFCLAEPQCALGSHLLKKLPAINETLYEQGMKIRERFSDTPEITFCEIPEGFKHIHHQFILHFEGVNGKDRNDLLDITTTKYGIRNIVQYYPLYRFPMFIRGGFGEHDCPVLDKWWDNSFSFPWWCGMKDDDIRYLVDCTKLAIDELKNAK